MGRKPTLALHLPQWPRHTSSARTSISRVRVTSGQSRLKSAISRFMSRHSTHAPSRPGRRTDTSQDAARISSGSSAATPFAAPNDFSASGRCSREYQVSNACALAGIGDGGADDKTGGGHFIPPELIVSSSGHVFSRRGHTHHTATRNRHMLHDISGTVQRVIRGSSHAHQPPLRPAVRALAHPRPSGLGPPRRSADSRAAARGADRAAAVLPRRQDEGRAAEARAQPVHRAVPQERFLDRPSRRGAAVSRA